MIKILMLFSNAIEGSERRAEILQGEQIAPYNFLLKHVILYYDQ